jgi:small subunit ribosomal protein S4e
MGHTTGRKHLKRLAAPKTWPIPRKGAKWIIKPSPGPHSMEMGMPIAVWLRDYLGIAKNMREVRFILNNEKILVDGRPVRDPSFQVGLMDTLSIPDLDKHFRVLINHKLKLFLHEIPEEESKCKIVRVIRKQMVKGGRIQVTGHDGRNFIIDSEIKVGDGLLISLPDQNIEKIIPIKEGTIVYFFYGAKAGSLGRVKEIKVLRKPFGHTRFVVYEDLVTGEIKETVFNYAIPVGEQELEISLPFGQKAVQLNQE